MDTLNLQKRAPVSAMLDPKIVGPAIVLVFRQAQSAPDG